MSEAPRFTIHLDRADRRVAVAMSEMEDWLLDKRKGTHVTFTIGFERFRLSLPILKRLLEQLEKTLDDAEVDILKGPK